MKYSNFTVRIPEELKEEVKERAKSEGLTGSDVVMVALAKFLEKSNKNKKSKEIFGHAYVIGGSKSLKIKHKSNKRTGKHIIPIPNPSPLSQKPYDRVKELIGQISIDIPDLGRNHKHYISECFKENE
ncbi:MAG: ribbon-helix-helix domain-containing protein [Deltaproteobacteria bacterium]|nr:ribbon-helix-helix domain-containing protein [Deltaproteobacteria bacterium]